MACPRGFGSARQIAKVAGDSESPLMRSLVGTTRSGPPSPSGLRPLVAVSTSSDVERANRFLRRAPSMPMNFDDTPQLPTRRPLSQTNPGRLAVRAGSSEAPCRRRRLPAHEGGCTKVSSLPSRSVFPGCGVPCGYRLAEANPELQKDLLHLADAAQVPAVFRDERRDIELTEHAKQYAIPDA